MSLSIGSPFDFRGTRLEEIRKNFAEMRTRIEAAHRRRKSYRNTVFELSQCSDRDLSDLGIARCDIRRLARESCDQQAIKEGWAS